MLITCGKCGSDVSDKAMRCPKCGTPVKPLAVSCPECGKEMPESALQGDCPHCGYPLRYFRLPSSPGAPRQAEPQAPPAAQPLECPNCGFLDKAAAGGPASRKCPKCGFTMCAERTARREERAVSPPRYGDGAAPAELRDAPRRRPLPLRIAAWLAIALLAAALLAGSAALALRFDIGGMRSSLKAAASSEETEESVSGRFAGARLWLKYAIGVVLDQFPDSSSAPSGASVSGQGP